jgi:hypothetical protein
VVAVLMVFGVRSFIALGNYSILDQQSQLGVDQMTREIRQATTVVNWQTNASSKWILFTNAVEGFTVKYSWAADSRELVARYSSEGEDRILLRGCDKWDFSLWQRSPYKNLTNVFYGANTPALCKLINMDWKCSRSVLGTNLINTETIQTAQIVLRNQQSN